MFPASWVPVLPSARLPAARPVGLRRMGERVVLWRGPDGRPLAHSDRCPHRGVALSGGRVRPDGALACPYHGFAFGPDGRCRDMPVLGPGHPVPPGFDLSGWPATEARGLIWLWWGALPEALPEVPWFEEIHNDWTHNAEVEDTWPLNHVRLTEAFFDVHHLRWVHGSIMPGVGEVLDPYEVEVDEAQRHIRTRGTLRRAGASRGLGFRVELRFPNLVLLDLGGRVKGLALATPVDEDESWVYLRIHQRLLPLPLLGALVARLLALLELHVVQRRQDLPVLLTQEPRHPAPGVDRLVRADAGTAAYLRLRQRLLRETG